MCDSTTQAPISAGIKEFKASECEDDNNVRVSYYEKQ